MSTKSDASNRYTGKNYDRISLIIKKGMRDLLREHADKSGVSVNRLINRALAETVPGFEMIDGVPVDQRRPETTTGTAPDDQDCSDGNDGNGYHDGNRKKPF